MSEQKPKRKSIGEHFTYAYLRHIKKWMFCPNCESGKLAFNMNNQNRACNCSILKPGHDWSRLRLQG